MLHSPSCVSSVVARLRLAGFHQIGSVPVRTLPSSQIPFSLTNLPTFDGKAWRTSLTVEKPYLLRLAVKLHSINSIAELEAGTDFHIRAITISLSKNDRYLVLKAAAFETEDDALHFLPYLKAGLWNLALEYNIAFIPDFAQRQITRADDPESAGKNLAKSFGLAVTGPVHGLADEGGALVYRSDEEIRIISFGAASGYVSTRLEDVVRAVREGIQSVDSNVISKPGKLTTAIDLYLGHFYEQSIRARFLTLMMVLEVLAPVTEKHRIVQAMIAAWKAEIREHLERVSDPNAVDALRALDRELDFRKETSIRRRIRQLILDVAPLDAANAVELARRVVNAYDLRGSLIHSGTVEDSELRDAFEVALNTVQLLLRALLGFKSKRV